MFWSRELGSITTLSTSSSQCSFIEWCCLEKVLRPLTAAPLRVATLCVTNPSVMFTRAPSAANRKPPFSEDSHFVNSPPLTLMALPTPASGNHSKSETLETKRADKKVNTRAAETYRAIKASKWLSLQQPLNRGVYVIPALAYNSAPHARHCRECTANKN